MPPHRYPIKYWAVVSDLVAESCLPQPNSRGAICVIPFIKEHRCDGELQPPYAHHGAEKGGCRNARRRRLERNCPAKCGKRLLSLAALPRPRSKALQHPPSFFSRCTARQRQSLYLAESAPCPGLFARDISCNPPRTETSRAGYSSTTPLNFHKRRQPQHRQNGQVSTAAPLLPLDMSDRRTSMQ